MRRARIHLDFRRQFCVAERLFSVFIVGRSHIVILRDRDEELRLALRRLKMRTVRFIRYKSTAME